MKKFPPGCHRLSLRVLGALACLLAGGCATQTKVSPALTEQVRQMAEVRDTCTQYAAWVARDYRPEAPEYKRAQQLYIEASAAANSYIEALQFNVAAGAPFLPDKSSEAAQHVEDSSRIFLAYAKEAVGVPKTRGFPLLIPALAGLIDLGKKLSEVARNANQQQRELLIKTLDDKKWKRFNELSK